MQRKCRDYAIGEADKRKGVSLRLESPAPVSNPATLPSQEGELIPRTICISVYSPDNVEGGFCEVSPEYLEQILQIHPLYSVPRCC